MLDNQNKSTKNSYSSPELGVSRPPTIDLDSQIVDDLLKQLEEQEIKPKNTNNQNPDSLLSVPGEKGTVDLEKILLGDKKEETRKNSEKDFVQSLESLKNAKLNYEKINQHKDEKKIFGMKAIETYLYWVEESRKLLKKAVSDEEKGKIFLFIPKRIQKQIETETLSPIVLDNSEKIDLPTEQTVSPEVPHNKTDNEEKEEAPKDEEKSVLYERIRRLEERINKLDQNKPEYLEELLPLKNKKTLVEEEIKNKGDNDPISDEDNEKEKLKQETSVKELINKQSFENKAPVAQPKKEERERLKKAQLAEELEKEEIKEETKKIQPIKIIKKKEEPLPFYSAEQIESANEMRAGFHKKLSSLEKSEWYQSPSINRDFVNKQIIQVAVILSGKESMEIDMRDIQTARIFMFNNVPKKILDHPAFSYVESFYNYQSSQGCFGINPEEAFLKQQEGSSTEKEASYTTEKGITFMEQISDKKTENGTRPAQEETLEENSDETEEESDVLENTFLD